MGKKKNSTRSSSKMNASAIESLDPNGGLNADDAPDFARIAASSSSDPRFAEPGRDTGLRRREIDKSPWRGPDTAPTRDSPYSPRAGAPVDGRVVLPPITEGTRMIRAQPNASNQVDGPAERSGFTYEED